MSERVTLEILRYRPEVDAEPHFQTYTIPYEEDWVVLDALNHIKDHVDATLSYRWSCHMAICGSCGMMINGEPKLACYAFLRDYRKDVIRIEYGLDPLQPRKILSPICIGPVGKLGVAIIDIGRARNMRPHCRMEFAHLPEALLGVAGAGPDAAILQAEQRAVAMHKSGCVRRNLGHGAPTGIADYVYAAAARYAARQRGKYVVAKRCRGVI